jgi:hypothetical protein
MILPKAKVYRKQSTVVGPMGIASKKPIKTPRKKKSITPSDIVIIKKKSRYCDPKPNKKEKAYKELLVIRSSVYIHPSYLFRKYDARSNRKILDLKVGK